MTITRPLAAGGPTTGEPERRRVRGHDGALGYVEVHTVVKTVERWTGDLDDVDPLRVATKTINGLYDGATADELDRLTIQTAADLIGEEPQYSRLAARLLADRIDREVRGQGITSFSEAIRTGHAEGLIGDATAAFVAGVARELDDAVDPAGDLRFEYFGLRTVYDRYLLRHPTSRLVIETPQYWLLRVACGLSRTPAEAIEFYRLMSSLAYLPSSPTLFNSGTAHPQMSSCFLVDSPRDELDSIYERYAQVAKLSKFAGGIGIAWSRVRSRGALIRGTNGRSNGIVPWLRTLDASVAAVNQGGRRKGAACVYLEPWHPDIEEFLELRDNTGEDARRTHNLNLANWIPDEFMRRVEADEMWSLFDPSEVPELVDLYGEAFDAAYRAAERDGRYVRQVRARDLYGRMMRTLAQTGNGWMTFKDTANRRCNQTGRPGNVVHLSNLCTEIIEVSSDAETAVCNLGSVNLAAHLGGDDIDWPRLRETVRTATVFLDRVIDLNHYPTPQAAASNARWRPVGLGVMGLQDVFFALRLPFDSAAARELSTRIAEEIYLTALETSADLAERYGPHSAFPETRAAQGLLQPDLWGVTPTQTARWAAVRERIARHGLRNSLLVAIAPTATIASIAGCYECVEPQVSNLFKRETLSGEFLQINTALVRELKARGLWTESIRAEIKRADGSVQHIAALPADLRELFRTAWELPQRALIDLAAARGPYVDQSQSLNLFMAAPTIGKLSSMYLYAWKAGLKTTYYLRSRPATRIQQATVAPAETARTPAADVSCSLENPEICDACQ
ncbi:ribonucleoside-diphosphate reductase [Thermopolyspora flexuosa]|uniref:Ribonucleoside-diphosphate reductase n=1 Tax=Thermopolyspora flexuosa TaxID=103836 RepID=A0A543IQD6_9ACTN|nr:ribonucleoside-diphosphate reductase subunit alpha [Thermopolyspora flexuosa]TQM72759.1 ribonucleoside-diphosphate reductase alpha chain [Thermopolyspora flexuosa]GGM68149.1 ribonucleoside-diphosphate reductase [Thermopolyspora flexuosa]